jgi:tRNA U55 pseudouridine synthase TruB
MLGTVACLAALERERAGLFELQNSLSLQQIADAKSNGQLAEHLESVEERLPQPSLELSQEQCKKLTFGQRVALDRLLIQADKDRDNLPEFVLALHQGKLVAVCSIIKQEVADAAKCGESSIVELKPEVVLSDANSF